MAFTFATLLALAAEQRTVYYAGGFANHVTMEGRFELTSATFDPTGSLLSSRNITNMDAFMMGYVRVSPDRQSAVFSAQTKNKQGGISPHVLLYEIPIDSENAEPAQLLPDISALTSQCQKPFAPCTQADQFHPTFDYTATEPVNGDDQQESVAFGFRAWTAEGMPGGNQALALLTRPKRESAASSAVPDATNSIRLLTYNHSDIHTMDSCPLFVPGSKGKQLVFTRDLLEGAEHTIAHLDIHENSSKITELDLTFAPADFAGCPSFVASPVAPHSDKDGRQTATFVFIGQNSSSKLPASDCDRTADRYEYARDDGISTVSAHWGGTVHLHDGGNVTTTPVVGARKRAAPCDRGIPRVYMVAVTIAVGPPSTRDEGDATGTTGGKSKGKGKGKGIVISEEVLFEMPRVNSSSAEYMLSLQYCSQVMQQREGQTAAAAAAAAPLSAPLAAPLNALICKTADMKLEELDPATGEERVNMTMPWPVFPNGQPIMWAFTSYSFQVWADGQ